MTMDAFDNKEKYQDFLIKLEAAKESIHIDESLRGIIMDSEDILVKVKSLSDATFYQNINVGFSISGAVVFILHILFLVQWAGIIGLLILCFLFVRSRVLVNRQILEINKFAESKHLEAVVSKPEVLAFLKYISEGINLKLLRFQLLRILISIVLPFILVAGVELISSRVGFLEAFLAFILGALFGVFYFKSDIDDLIFMKDKILKYIQLI